MCDCTLSQEKLAALHADAEARAERQRQIIRTNAAACLLCPSVERGADMRNWREGVAICIDGTPTGVHCVNSSCPDGRHVDPDTGLIDFVGVNWRGLAAPARWIVWALSPRHPAPSSFEGCGCVDSLKRVIEWVVERCQQVVHRRSKSGRSAPE